MSVYNSDLNTYARSMKKPWSQDSEAGRPYCQVYRHLYRFLGEDELVMRQIVTDVNAVWEMLAKGRVISPDMWRRCQRYLRSTDGKKTWGRNDEAIRRAICYAGMFVIRTNAQSDPFKALEVYRMRGIVELDFQQFKN